MTSYVDSGNTPGTLKFYAVSGVNAAEADAFEHHRHPVSAHVVRIEERLRER